MAKKPSGKKPQQSILQEAWSNMSTDLDAVLPEKLRGRQGKKRFVLWLFLLELLVLGLLGRLLYAWWTGS